MDRNQAVPARLYVEPTTRCNLRCRMCVKQSTGSRIREGDLSPETFAGLHPLFDKLESIVFSGIGEPLLYPHLEDLISMAAEQMPINSRIGIQTNGLLLDEPRLVSLRKAGLNTLCLSLDSSQPEVFRKVRDGGKLSDMERALNTLQESKADSGKGFQFGIEVVLMKQNLHDLPGVLDWTVQKGASFAIVTNVVPYNREHASQCVNSSNLKTSLDLYGHYKQISRDRNLDLDDYLSNRFRYRSRRTRDKSLSPVIELGEALIEEAYSREIPLNLDNLISEDTATLEEARKIFEQARGFAIKNNLNLILPELYPKFQRQCEFVENNSIFLSRDGEIHACYFLWHQYRFYQNGRQVRVTPLPLGNLNRENILDIWNGEKFSSFREKVLQYKYPFCENCTLSPCNLFTEKEFEFDCYTIDIPCGSCPWCGGLLHCLQ